MNICVFSSSSNKIDKVYFDSAKNLAVEMAKRQFNMVFGSGQVGLMGEMARTLHELGGETIGVVPERLNRNGIVFENCSEIIVTKDMRERKHIMDIKSDAVITLPGGFGTLEELSEMITGKQLGFHNKPIVILNVNNFYSPLIELFDEFCTQNFAKADCKNLYFITKDITEALDYIQNYKAEEIYDKYLFNVGK